MKFKERIYLLNILTNSSKELICIAPNYDITKKLEKSELSNYYENADILNKLPSNTKILNFNLENMTIDEVKIILAKEIGENFFDLYLYGIEKSNYSYKRKQQQIRNSMFKEPIFKNEIQLGFEYSSEYGVKSLPNNYLKYIDKKVQLNNLDERVDLGTDLIRNYNLKNNVIYVTSRKALISFESTKYNDSIPDIEAVYFGRNNPYKDAEEYKLFISEKYDLVVLKNKLLQSQLKVLYKLDKTLLSQCIDTSSIKFNNLVLESNIGDNKDINLEYVFKNFEFNNNDVLFLHFYDTIKTNYYRLNEENLFPNIAKVKPDSLKTIDNVLRNLRSSLSKKHKSVKDIKSKYKQDDPIQSDDLVLIKKIEEQKQLLFTEIKAINLQKKKLETRNGFDFNNSDNYLVDFVKGKYDVSVNKKTLQGWKKNIYLSSEQDVKLKLKGMECLSIKIKYEDMIITLVINRFGEIYIKTTDLVNDYHLHSVKMDEMIKLVNKCVTYINTILKDNDKLSLVSNEMNLKNLNTMFTVNLLENDSLENFRSRIFEKCPCGFVVDNDEKTFSLKLMRVKFGYSSFNARKYFFMLKNSQKQLSVSKLKDLWISKSAEVFGLSRVEALNELEYISQEIENEDFKNPELEDIIDIVFTQGETNKELVVSCLNIKHMNDFEFIKKYLISLVNFRINSQIKASSNNSSKFKSASPPVIIQAAVVKQTFVNDDDLEIDIDYSDSDSDSDSESELESESKVNESKSPLQQKVIEKQQLNSDNSKTGKQETNVKEKVSTFTKILPKNIREYMINMRKERDARLFIFKKSDMFDSYSSKCGAVDMRQPILISDFEVENMMRNPYAKKAYEQSKDSHLKWGSTKENLNTFMCPRVWCIRDNVEIRPIDLVENNGKCPICQGEIIDQREKTIGKNKTILLRKGKSNNYWGDTMVPEDYLMDIPLYKDKYAPLEKKLKQLETDGNSELDVKKKIELIKSTKKQLEQIENEKSAETNKSIKDYKELWNLYLKGTEKLAYPSFLKNKTHPEDMCMPCCNANLKKLDENVKAIPNYDRCLNQRIHAYAVLDGNYDLVEQFKPNHVMQKLKSTQGVEYQPILEIGNTILVFNKSNPSQSYLLEVYNEGSKLVKKFTDKEINFINGISFELPEANLKWLSYQNSQSSPNHFFIRQVDTKIKGNYDINYILGKEKFPLSKNKLGVLVDEVDKIFNKLTVTSIIKGSINFEKREATQDDIEFYNNDKKNNYQLFFNTIGVPDVEWMNENKKKNKDKLEVGDMIIINYEGFLRKGTNQNVKYSIYSAFQNVRNVHNIRQFVQLLIDILTPEVFLSLNCGEIFKAFSQNNYDYKDEININLFSQWIKYYSNFVGKYFNLYKTITNIDIEKQLNLPNKNTFDLYLLYDIHVAHENYKKYICDLNILKEHIYVVDLLCQEIPQTIVRQYLKSEIEIQNPDKINLFVFEFNDKTNKINIVNPPGKDSNNFIDFSKNKTVVLYKNNNIYENIVYAKQIYGNKIVDYNIVPSKKIIIFQKVKILIENADHDEIYSISTPSLDNFKNSNFVIDSYVIDRYFKGIGIILNYKLKKYFIYTKPFSCPIEKVKITRYQNESLPKQSFVDLINFHSIIKQNGINIYAIKGLLNDDKNNVLGCVTNTNLTIPLKSEKYKVESGLEILGSLESNELDFMLNTELNILDERFTKINEIEHETKTYKIFKNTLSLFMRKYKGRFVSNLKAELESLISNSALPYYIKFNESKKILLPVLNKIFEIISSKLSYNEQTNKQDKCINQTKTTCKLLKHNCLYKENDKKLFGRGVCAFKIDKELFNKFTNLVVNELIYFSDLKMKIFNGSFKIEQIANIVDVKNLILDTSYDDFMDQLYSRNNLVYLNPYFDKSYDFQKILAKLTKTTLDKHPPIIQKGDSSIKPKESLQPDVSVNTTKKPTMTTQPIPVHQPSQANNQTKSKSNSGNLAKFKGHNDLGIYANTIDWDGIDHSKNDKIMAGRCVDKFKVRGDPNSPYTGCNFITNISPKSRGKVCATKIKTNKATHNGTFEKFGFCDHPFKQKSPQPSSEGQKISPPISNVNNKSTQPKIQNGQIDDEGNIVPEIYADVIDGFGNKIPTKDSKLKPGKCIFPFKYRSKKLPLSTEPRGRIYKGTNGKKDEIKQFWDCIPVTSRSKKDPIFGYKCPTSLKKDKTIDTYAFCPPKKQVIDQVQNKPFASFKKITKHKLPESLYSQKTNTTNKQSIKVNSKQSTQVNNSQKVKYGINYRYDKLTGKKQFLNPRYYKPGKCIYPFKYKKKIYNFPECPKSSDKVPIEFCAIETGKQDGVTKFGMCLPDGVSLEQYNKQIDDLIELNKKSQKKHKVKFPLKKKTQKISKSANWVAKLYNDSNLKIIKTRDNGDCLFDAIRIAYDRPSMTVKTLRQMVSDNLQDYHLDLYKTLYNNAVINRDSEIIGETKFIAGIETIYDLKEYVLNSRYWADMLSINLLERLLKVKIFIFSETNYLSDDFDNIINCGNNLQEHTISKCKICGVTSDTHTEIIKNTKKIDLDRYLTLHKIDISKLNDAKKYDEYLKLSEKDKHHFEDVTVFGAVKPNNFILVNYETGLHYKLISYKNKKLFTSFKELPQDLVDNLKSKCSRMIELAYFN